MHEVGEPRAFIGWGTRDAGEVEVCEVGEVGEEGGAPDGSSGLEGVT